MKLPALLSKILPQRARPGVGDRSAHPLGAAADDPPCPAHPPGSRLTRKRLGLNAFLALCALVLAALLYNPYGYRLLSLVGIAGTLLFLFSCLTMILTLRQTHRHLPCTLLLFAAVGFLCTALFFALAGNPYPLWALMGATVAGGLLGSAWALTSLLFVDAGLVQARGKIGCFALWASVLTLAQLSAHLNGRCSGVMVLFSCFAMGMVLCHSLGLLWRIAQTQRAGASP